MRFVCNKSTALSGWFLVIQLVASAQGVPTNWSYADPAADSVAGISLNKAYELLKGKTPHTVVVAVIDNGFDIQHEDLKDIIWTNQKEIPGNGIDDDHNGYIDDIHGWNFRSTRDGSPVADDQLESTRIYARWKNRYDTISPRLLPKDETKQYNTYQKAKAAYLESINHLTDSNAFQYAYNLNYSASKWIGDNPDDPYEHNYGSPFIMATAALSHGTHVAGIIGAVRNNGKGIDGIADHVLIMPLIATTGNGDERDKDIANAIRYAVDNGAKLINMSFSKQLSPYKQVVDEAVRYAEKHEVLIFHAAGNDGVNDDSISYYPIARYENGRKATNFITVGWSRSKFDYRLAHPYSNYGKNTVDLFAPGSDILSTVPFNEYGSKSGSSMSTPCVTGVAAILYAYFPSLPARKVKAFLLASVFKPATMVNRPGSKQSVPFNSLSISGGIVNAYNAVKKAMEEGY